MRTNQALRWLLAIALLATQWADAAFADTSAGSKLPVMRITLSDPIERHMPYSNGTMTLTDTEGNTIEMKAKFKTRGATAQSYLMKPSLNMKLRTDDYSSSQDSMLLGIRSASKWILDAMAIDRICMRNRVCMDVWNALSPLPYDTDFGGRSGTVGKFIELYINGDYMGIYCLSDHINRKLLNLKKYDEEKGRVRGVLYKSGTSDIANQNERNFKADYTAATISYHNAWELKEPEDHECMEAWEPLVDLHDNRTTYADVRKYFDIDNLVDFQLHVLALSIVDNWGNKNHFFSIRNMQKDIDDPDPTEAARRKCLVTPWDLDCSLGGNYQGTNHSGTYTDWAVEALPANGGFYPFYVCQGQQEYQDKLKARWAEVRSTVFSTQSINARLEAYRDLFLNSGAWERMVKHFDAQSDRPLYVDDLAKEVAYIEEWYADRHDKIDRYFGIDPTGIENLRGRTDGSQPEAIHSLQGIRLKEAPLKGLYIQGGKLKASR